MTFCEQIRSGRVTFKYTLGSSNPVAERQWTGCRCTVTLCKKENRKLKVLQKNLASTGPTGSMVVCSPRTDLDKTRWEGTTSLPYPGSPLVLDNTLSSPTFPLDASGTPFIFSLQTLPPRLSVLQSCLIPSDSDAATRYGPPWTRGAPVHASVLHHSG